MADVVCQNAGSAYGREYVLALGSNTYQCTQAMMDAMVTYQAACSVPGSFFGFDPRGTGWNDPLSYQAYCQTNGVVLVINPPSFTPAPTTATSVVTSTSTSSTAMTTAVSSTVSTSVTNSSSDSSSSGPSSGLVIGAVAGGIVLLAIIGYMLWRRSNQKNAPSVQVRPEPNPNEFTSHNGSVPSKAHYVQYGNGNLQNADALNLPSYDAVDAVQF